MGFEDMERPVDKMAEFKRKAREKSIARIIETIARINKMYREPVIMTKNEVGPKSIKNGFDEYNQNQKSPEDKTKAFLADVAKNNPPPISVGLIEQSKQFCINHLKIKTFDSILNDVTTKKQFFEDIPCPCFQGSLHKVGDIYKCGNGACQKEFQGHPIKIVIV